MRNKTTLKTQTNKNINKFEKTNDKLKIIFEVVITIFCGALRSLKEILKSVVEFRGDVATLFDVIAHWNMAKKVALFNYLCVMCQYLIACQYNN